MAKTNTDRITEAVAALRGLNAITVAESLIAAANAPLWGPLLAMNTGARGFEHFTRSEETRRRRALRGMRLKYLLLGADAAFIQQFDYWAPEAFAVHAPRRLIEGQIRWLSDFAAAPHPNPAARAANLAQAGLPGAVFGGPGENFVYGDTQKVPNVCYNASVSWWHQAGVFSWPSMIQPGVSGVAWARNNIANALIVNAGANPALDKYGAIGDGNPAVPAGSLVWMGVPNSAASDHIVLSLGGGDYLSVNTPNAITPGVDSPGPLPTTLTHAELTAIVPAAIPGVPAPRRMVEISIATFSARLAAQQWRR